MKAVRRVSLPALFNEATNFLRSCSVSSRQEQLCKQLVPVLVGAGVSYLADALEDGDGLLEVSHVEAGQYQLDMPKVAIAVRQLLPAAFAFPSLV